MAGLGHDEKNSHRAYYFRNVPDSCRKRVVPAFTFSATDRDRGVPHGTAPPTPPGIRVRTTAVRLSYAWAVT